MLDSIIATVLLISAEIPMATLIEIRSRPRKKTARPSQLPKIDEVAALEHMMTTPQLLKDLK